MKFGKILMTGLVIVVVMFFFYVIIFITEEKQIICEYHDGTIIESTISVSQLHGEKLIAERRCQELITEPISVVIKNEK